MSRSSVLVLLLLTTLLDWFVTRFNPEANIENWLAAAGGALILRIVPGMNKLPLSGSFMAWLSVFLVALMMTPSLVRYFSLFDSSVGAHCGAALAFDLLLRIITFLIRYGGKVADYSEANPGEAFDQGLERVEKTVSVWGRIKAPVLDILATVFGKKP